MARVSFPFSVVTSYNKAHTVTSSLGTDEGTSPVTTLAGQDTSELVPLALVSTEQVTNFPSTNTNVTSRNILVGTNVLGQLPHEGETEAADLTVGLALRVKVGTTLTTTKGEAGESILVNLLVTQELQDGKVDGGVKTETTGLCNQQHRSVQKFHSKPSYKPISRSRDRQKASSQRTTHPL